MTANGRSHTTADTITATRRIAAPPGTIFAVLVDPTTHADVHRGSLVNETMYSGRIGRIEEALDTELITRAGQRFRMAMYHEQHPNKNYETLNEVLVYEPSLAIAWRTGYLDGDGLAQFGGWLWRYDLAQTNGSVTEVTLTYDWSAATQEARDIIDFPPFGLDHLDSSLSHLDDIVATIEE